MYMQEWPSNNNEDSQPEESRAEQPKSIFEKLSPELKQALHRAIDLVTASEPVGKSGARAFDYEEESSRSPEPFGFSMLAQAVKLKDFMEGKPVEVDKDMPLVRIGVHGAELKGGLPVDFSFDADGVLRKYVYRDELLTPEEAREEKREQAFQRYQDEHERDEVMDEAIRKAIQQGEDILAGKAVLFPAGDITAQDIGREMGIDVANEDDVKDFLRFLTDPRVVQFAAQERERLAKKSKPKRKK